MLSLKELKFRITRRFRCKECKDAWTCTMDILPTRNIRWKNATVQALLENSLKTSCSDLFENLNASDLNVNRSLLAKKVRDCPEMVEIECRRAGLFCCPGCSYPEQFPDNKPADFSQQLASGISNYSLSFHNLTSDSGISESDTQDRTYEPVSLVIPPSYHCSMLSRPLPPLPLSVPGEQIELEELCSVSDNIFHHTTTKDMICSALVKKEKGCYAVVELEVTYGGEMYHRTPYILLCLSLDHHFKVVLKDPSGELFIHRGAKFKTLKALLLYYKTHLTKCGTTLSRQLTKAELAAHLSTVQ